MEIMVVLGRIAFPTGNYDKMFISMDVQSDENACVTFGYFVW